MYRWTAKLLLLVMLMPAFGPLALARASQPIGMHCMRRAATPMKHCHHGIKMAPGPQSSETSLYAGDNCCCQNHNGCNCCCGPAAPRWAEPQSQPVSQSHSPSQAQLVAEILAPTPLDLIGRDSARAPPQS